MSRADGAEKPLDDAGCVRDAQRRAPASQRPSGPLDVPQRDAVEEDHAGHVDDEIAAGAAPDLQALDQPGRGPGVELPGQDQRPERADRQQTGRPEQRPGVGLEVGDLPGHVSTVPPTWGRSVLSSPNRPEMVNWDYRPFRHSGQQPPLPPGTPTVRHPVTTGSPSIVTAPWTPRIHVTTSLPRVRLTQLAHGGGCACKIPPGELEDVVRGLQPSDGTAELLVGLDSGDDAAAVRLDGSTALLSTADFFTPVVDDPYDWGRIAAANALSDIYAMGGTPLLAINLLAWPRETLSFDLAREVLRGGLDIARQAGCHVAGGHSIDDAEPKYGMAVTGTARPDALIRNNAGVAGQPLTLTKPLGLGVLNNRHKATAETFPEAVEVMTTLNRDAAAAAVAAGIRAGTDVTGFGLLGHLHKLARASGLTAVVDVTAVPVLDAARGAVSAGFVSGGTRRNLDWVSPHLDSGTATDDDVILLADAQTSGGLLLAGELPGHPVIGELVPRRDDGCTLALR